MHWKSSFCAVVRKGKREFQRFFLSDFFLTIVNVDTCDECRNSRFFFQFFISYPSFKRKLWGRNWMKLLSGLFSFIRRADEIPQIDDCDKLQPQLEFTYVLCEFCSNFESKRLRRFSCEFECGKLKKLLLFFQPRMNLNFNGFGNEFEQKMEFSQQLHLKEIICMSSGV